MDDENPQIDELVTTDYDSNKTKSFNMLTKEQHLILDIVQHINDPNLQKQYLDCLTNSLDDKQKEKPSKLPSTSIGLYNLTKMLDRKKQHKKPQGPIQDLQA